MTIDDILDPVLHIQLGLMTHITSHMFMWIRRSVQKMTNAADQIIAATFDNAVSAEEEAEEAYEAWPADEATHNALTAQRTILSTQQKIVDESTASIITLEAEREAIRVQLDALTNRHWDMEQARTRKNREKRPFEDAKKAAKTKYKAAVEAIKNLEAPLSALRVAWTRATAARVREQKEFEKLKPGESELPFDEILKDYKIVRAVYWSGGLTGRDCWRFMEHRKKIFEDLGGKLKILKKTGVEDDVIDSKLQKFEALVESFYPICRMMRSIEKQPLEKIEKLRFCCKAFGLQWRALFGTVAPKVHVLESHIPDQMARFLCLGLFSEDPIERLHHIELTKLRLWSNIRDYYAVEEHIDKTTAAAHTSAVNAIRAEVGDRTKRRLSPESIERARLRELAENVARDADIAEILAKHVPLAPM